MLQYWLTAVLALVVSTGPACAEDAKATKENGKPSYDHCENMVLVLKK